MIVQQQVQNMPNTSDTGTPAALLVDAMDTHCTPLHATHAWAIIQHHTLVEAHLLDVGNQGMPHQPT
jgi:hypothetical protein